MDHPISGQVILLAGAKASVPLERLPRLLERVAVHVDAERASYERRFERVAVDDERSVYLVPRGHWTEVGEAVELAPRETDAVRRAHEEQFLRLGRQTGRREEFEHALDIREAVVVAD